MGFCRPESTSCSIHLSAFGISHRVPLWGLTAVDMQEETVLEVATKTNVLNDHQRPVESVKNAGQRYVPLPLL